MEDLTSFSFSGAIITWGVLVLAWLAERLFPLSSALDPIAFFRFVCDRMAAKVLPAKHQTQQHYISGALATLLLILPIVIIIWLVSEFASFPTVFSGILLYLCLQFSQQTRTLRTINDALKGDKKQLAKDLLAPKVLRDTSMLSALGINKASIEMYMLRTCYQQAVVLFWFACLGPIAALSYRLLFESSQSWNIKLSQFSRFGWLSHAVTSFLQWFPLRLFAIILLLVSLPSALASCFKRLLAPPILFGSNGAFALAALASALNKTMSGPVYYRSTKVQREKFSMLSEPALTDAAKTINLCLKATVALLWLLLVFLWVLHA